MSVTTTMASQDDLTMDVLAIRDRVQQAVARGSLGILGLGLWVKLIRLHALLDRMGRKVSAMDVRTEEDRRLLHECARDLQRCADIMSSQSDNMVGMALVPFRAVIVRLFDALAVKAEDIAETAALGASVDFANLVKEELKRHNAAKVDG